MLRPRNLLIAIADGEHARFVRPGPNDTLHRDSAFDSISAHKQSAALGSDIPGASFHSGSSAAHAETPRHDLHRMEKGKFAHLVGDELNAAAARAEFYELVIVAPAHVLTAIHNRLDVATRATLIGTLKKDLVKTPDHELWPHLAKWLGPMQRATG